MNKSPEFDMLKEPAEPGRGEREGALESQSRVKEEQAEQDSATWPRPWLDPEKHYAKS
jgi:hypothetical protein